MYSVRTVQRMEEARALERGLVKKTISLKADTLKYYYNWKSTQNNDLKIKFISSYNAWQICWNLIKDNLGLELALSVTSEPNKKLLVDV